MISKHGVIRFLIAYRLARISSVSKTTRCFTPRRFAGFDSAENPQAWAHSPRLPRASLESGPWDSRLRRGSLFAPPKSHPRSTFPNTPPASARVAHSRIFFVRTHFAPPLAGTPSYERLSLPGGVHFEPILPIKAHFPLAACGIKGERRCLWI